MSMLVKRMVLMLLIAMLSSAVANLSSAKYEIHAQHK